MSEVNIRQKDRQRHIYISGKTRYGKTTLMHSMVYQDMRQGRSLCLIDGKGNAPDPLSLKILDWVPQSRKDDVIYLDIDDPIPIDLMACRDANEAAESAADIGQMFNRLDPTIGRRMDSILQWIIVSLNIIGKPAFLDIYDVLTDSGLRDTIRKHPAIVNDPRLSKFWGKKAKQHGELPLSEKMMKSESGVALAITQMTKFVLSPPLVTVLGKAKNPLSIEQAIAEGKIIIVRLNAGHPASIIYGSLLTSKIQQTIFRRRPGTKHPPFMLYVDEFQDYKPDAFDRTLSQGGGLGLYLTVANQYFNQLDESTRSAIEGNVSTFFFFNQSKGNVMRLSDQIPGPYPPPAPDPRILRDLKEELRELKKWNTGILHHIHELHEWQDEAYRNDDVPPGVTPCEYNLEKASDQLRENEREQEKVKKQIDEREAPIPKPKLYLDMLPELQVGQAIYRGADGTVMKIRTPRPSPDPKSIGKTSYAKEIRERTLAEYRMIPEPPLQTPPVLHDEVDDDSFTTPEQDLPPYEGEESDD